MKTFVAPSVEMRKFDVEDALTTSAVESSIPTPTALDVVDDESGILG
jgi:hypothetical protein